MKLIKIIPNHCVDFQRSPCYLLRDWTAIQNEAWDIVFEKTAIGILYEIITRIENELKIEFVDGKNWKDALSKALILISGEEEYGDVSWLPDNLEEAKYDAYNADFMFEVKEIPE